MYTFICKECKKEFKNKNKNRLYCSNECRINFQKRMFSAKHKDLTNQKFGRLTALYCRNVNKRYEWYCRCECEKEIWVPVARLLNNHTKSCGCLNRETASENNNKYFLDYRKKNFIEDTNIAKIKSKIAKNNTSGIRGVYWHSSAKCWIAKLIFKKVTYSKSFKNKEEAILYRNELEEKYFKPILDKYKKR